MAGRVDIHKVTISLVFPKNGSGAANDAIAAVAVATAETAPTVKAAPVKGTTKKPAAKGQTGKIADGAADNDGTADKKVEVRVSLINAGDRAEIERRVQTSALNEPKADPVILPHLGMFPQVRGFRAG